MIAARWNAIIQMILVSFSHFMIGDNIFIILIGKIAGVWSDLRETIRANERTDMRR